MHTNEHLGKVERMIEKSGLIHIREEGISGRTFPATFDKIEDYRGERASELRWFSNTGHYSYRGLRTGILVKFTLRDNKVAKVRPLIFGC